LAARCKAGLRLGTCLSGWDGRVLLVSMSSKMMSGIFYIGLGDQFDGNKLKAFPPGSVIVLPGNTPHFHWAKSGEYITQVTAIGPLGLEYMNSKDDPRNQVPGAP
jgi:hypothetical protein